MPNTDVTRLAEKQRRDRPALDALLDTERVCHVALVVEEHPVVVPTAYARDGDRLLLHGSTGSGWMRVAAQGADLAVAVTALDGIVVARSAFESSMHYRSAVMFGVGRRLDGDEHARALDLLTEALIPGRAAEVRASTARELAATLVLALPLDRWSLKISDGPPTDEPDDVAGDAWAGVVPLHRGVSDPVPAPDLRTGIEMPDSVRALRP